MLPWDLEDWITDEGSKILDKRILSPNSLSSKENLLYEVWLLDTEARNGGLSQYFCNHGIEQWQACQAVAKTEGLKSLEIFAGLVNEIIQESSDPYTAIREKGNDAEDLWYLHQRHVVNELKFLYAKEL
jgi:hypothetical protein